MSPCHISGDVPSPSSTRGITRTSSSLQSRAIRYQTILASHDAVKSKTSRVFSIVRNSHTPHCSMSICSSSIKEVVAMSLGLIHQKRKLVTNMTSTYTMAITSSAAGEVMCTACDALQREPDNPAQRSKPDKAVGFALFMHRLRSQCMSSRQTISETSSILTIFIFFMRKFGRKSFYLGVQL